MARSRRPLSRASAARGAATAVLAGFAPVAAEGIAAGIAAAIALAVLAGCAGPRLMERPAPRPTEPGTAASAPAREPSDAWRSARHLRIGIAVGAPRALVSGSRAWTLRVVGGTKIAREEAGARLTVTRERARAIEVLREGDPKPLWSGGVDDTLELEPDDGGYSGWNGNWYRGVFRMYASRPEGLTLVNNVDLEGYLRSVLPNEIGTPPESEFEAVKAQAVAARSYTLAYLGRRDELGFDLYASVEDQVYAGKTLENSQSDRALDATRGEVLLSGDQPIRALYSSACGGRTANVEDVWPWGWTPYLRSVRDAAEPDSRPYCSLSSSFRWREEWQAAAFLAMLRQYAPPGDATASALQGDILDIRVERRSRCGRIQDLAVSTTAGDLILHGDRVRWALRRPGTAAILRSSFFKIGVLRDAGGRAARVIASGAGNGHGIGLCQWGAMGMARAGSGYRDILSHYYKATRLARM